MALKNKEILETDPYSKEKEQLSFYEGSSKKFYQLLTSNIQENQELTTLQREILFEIFVIFKRELKDFERSLADYPEAQRRFEVIFKTKEKYFDRILQRFSLYLSMQCFGETKNITSLNTKQIKNFLHRGMLEIISVCEEDMPKYDLLFEELDKASSDHKKVELFIGRDGIYAYEARRAMDISRRRKLKGEERKKRKLLEIHPRYINYNSVIKESFSEEDRRKYLEDNGVYPEDDLIIFDTGYRGSIPEQILRTLGKKDPDIEKRIKILGTDYYEDTDGLGIEDDIRTPAEIENIQKIRGRLVSGIKNDLENYDHVGKIEERGKKYMTATGMYVDEKGKLKPAENPFLSPSEYFFEYTLIELTLRQYYYNK